MYERALDFCELEYSVSENAAMLAKCDDVPLFSRLWRDRRTRRRQQWMECRRCESEEGRTTQSGYYVE